MKTVDEQLELARKAQGLIDSYTQEEVDELCLSVGWEVFNEDNVRRLAEMAVEETGFGNVESKMAKHRRRVGGVLHDLRGKKSVGCIERDPASGIAKYAKPVGVIGAILPATNPTSTAGAKALAMLKCRNAVLFRASSRAAKCTREAVSMMRAGLRRVGAPENLLQVLEDRSREGVRRLMASCDLVVATGSTPLVKAAHASGTPAYGVGQGNAVAMVAEDADICEAARLVFESKIFDYGSSCSSENAVLVVDSVYDEFLAALVALGSHLVEGEERAALMRHMWPMDGTGPLNRGIIARSARTIAEGAGIGIGVDVELLLVEGRLPVEFDRFHDEKLSPVLTLYRVRDIAHACELYGELTRRVGPGHSCGIHTFNEAHVEHLAQSLKTSRLTVRQGMSAANGGYPGNRMPATGTLGCGTWGGNITTENVNFSHFMNVTWVNEPVEPWSFDEEEMWGEFWTRHGR